MKKSVIILIGIIYIASIFVVGFFGMKIKSFDTIIYITDIECTNENVTTKAKDENPGGTSEIFATVASSTCFSESDSYSFF